MDPIHGYIPFTEFEKAVIDTLIIQRLHRLKQLGTAFLTYPSGVHTRFSHVVGAMHLAGLAAKKMVERSYLEEDDVQILRVSALLHDVGHGPFSHSSEEVIRDVTGSTHEDFAGRIITETELGDIFSPWGYDKKVISKLAVGKTEYKSKKFPSQIVAGRVDVDKMDFLNRDAYFTGVPYGKVDHQRLIEGLSVYGDEVVVNQNSVAALEQFMISRYEMFKAVYYHRTVRSSEILFKEVLSSLAGEVGIHHSITPEEYLKLDDGFIWTRLEQAATTTSQSGDTRATKLFNMLASRNLLKCCYEALRHESDPQGRILGNKSVLKALIDSIAERANVDPSLIFIDTPTLPGIPLNPLESNASEMKVYDEKTDSCYSLSSISPLASALNKYLAVIRVYTAPEHRKPVSEAASNIFKKDIISEKVSY